ncbi:hypothetical protein KUTeg_018468 [Tegillarca granosa]|uniref:DAGKc domain-containing protein n=1 Tax=Tegillarca granosa TaxID=220873 RepID=A0ABQ9EMW3_TEGGR|nr:hypothetical protein KUTeg_018468 [Tegillarca granosa]
MGDVRRIFDNYYFKGSQLHLRSKDLPEDEVIDTDDIIGVESVSADKQNIHIIEKLDTRQWKRKVLKFAFLEQEKHHNLATEWDTIRGKLMIFRPRRLLVLISSLSGSQNGQKRHNHILDIISTCNLQNIDGVVVLGGDGSYSQCANGLLERIQKDANIDYNNPDVKVKPTQLPIGHIPTGSLNLLSRLCFGCIDVETAALGIIKGKTYDIGIENIYADKKWVRGSLSCIYHGNINEFSVYVENFRWLKAARYAVVPLAQKIPGFRREGIHQSTLKDGNKDD